MHRCATNARPSRNATIRSRDHAVPHPIRLPSVRDASGTDIEPSEDTAGSKAVGIAVGGAIVGFLAIMPFVFLVALYLFLTIYAIVRAIGPGAGENAVTILIGFVLITTTFATLLGVAIHLVGRSLTPKRRRAKS
jgi:hypothetical protein